LRWRGWRTNKWRRMKTRGRKQQQVCNPLIFFTNMYFFSGVFCSYSCNSCPFFAIFYLKTETFDFLFYCNKLWNL
jgi:hypothetical protein